MPVLCLFLYAIGAVCIFSAIYDWEGEPDMAYTVLAMVFSIMWVLTVPIGAAWLVYTENED